MFVRGAQERTAESILTSGLNDAMDELSSLRCVVSVEGSLKRGFMKLTPERKQEIDRKSYEQLLSGWRFARIGDPWFQNETGDYWASRMKEVRDRIGNDEHVATSKAIGF